MSKTFVTLSTKKGTLQQKIARAEAGREEISAAGWDALVGWRDPAKRPPREKTQLKIGTESAAGWLLSFCPIQCHTALARSKGPPETPRGGCRVGRTVTHSLLWTGAGGELLQQEHWPEEGGETEERGCQLHFSRATTANTAYPGRGDRLITCIT